METETTVKVEDTGDKSPEQIAADQALARAGRPPEALGGPPAPVTDGAENGEGDEPVEPQRSGHMAKVANAERPDVLAVEDEYADARERAAAGVAAEDDWEAVTEWLLSDTSDVITRKLMLRVGGGDDDPQILPWIIRAVGIDVIRTAEREAAGNRQQRRDGQGYDELKANLRIVVEGTVRPDLKPLARGKGLADATVLVQRRFAYRPGLIAQIAGEIMSVSGFDADDVRAAGN